MNLNPDDVLSGKITDLTESLYRTTDVLSSADRMIDHYRDLNKEQEHEIEKLKGSLHKVNHNKKTHYDNESTKRSHSTLKDEFDTSLSSIDEQYLRTSHANNKSKVRFEEDFQKSKLSNLETSINEVSHRQNVLEEEMSRERFKERDLERFDLTLQKELSSLREESRSQSVLDERLKTLQEKIEKDHNSWKSQQKEMQILSKEMSSLKDVVKEVATPKKQIPRLQEPSLDVKELERYKNRVIKDKEIIGVLQEELRAKVKEKTAFESTVHEIQNLGHMKNNQLKLLEDQLIQEKKERSKLENNLKEMHYKMEDVEKERNEVLHQYADVKAESKLQQVALERSSHNVPELKMLLERSERQRDKLSEHIYKLKNDIETKDVHIGTLSKEVSDCTGKLSSLDAEKKTLLSQSDSNQQDLYDTKRELENTKKLLTETDNRYKDCERSKRELKEKAIHTLKEYRLKCRKYEQRIEDAADHHKTKTAEAARETARAKEIEISNLKLQKEYQELMYELESLREEFNGRDKRLNQLLDDRQQMEQTLQQASHASKMNNDLKREIEELKNEKLSVNSQLLDEKRKRKEFESLLHENYEKQLSAKDQSASLQRRLQEERETRSQLSARLQDELSSQSRLETRKLENKNKALEDEKNELLDKLKKFEYMQTDLARNMEFIEKDKSESENKEKFLAQKIKKLSEENGRIRKQYQAMKKSYEDKIKTIESSVTMEKDQKGVLQTHVSEYQAETAKAKEAIKMLINIPTRDVENLLNLLCREEENMLPVKEIPETMSPEHQKVLGELREKLQTCYSICKTLKQKFQQQKGYMKKYQERIKKQKQEYEQLHEESMAHQEEMTTTISKLEKTNATSDGMKSEQKRQVVILQNQVRELTKHLEECTNALQKSLEMEEDRQKVLLEIDQLRNEHKERQKMDETYYRNTEKIDILTDQLTDAKNSLDQYKQESLDNTVFANRVLETFASVSPSCRKRSYNNTSPRTKLSRTSLFQESSSYVPTYLDELENTPTRDRESASPPVSRPSRTRVVDSTNDLDPMSMTDEEFDKAFLSKKNSSKQQQQPSSRNYRNVTVERSSNHPKSPIPSS